MKEKDGYTDCPEQQVILYVEKQDGQYGPMQTGSYLSGHYLDDFFMKRRNLEASLRREVAEGKISLVKYYMVLEDLSLSELASRTGIRQGKVKKHLDPVQFGIATVDELRRYASVFNVQLANLVQMVVLQKGDQTESLQILETTDKQLPVTMQATQNPFVTVTRIQEKEHDH